MKESSSFSFSCAKSSFLPRSKRTYKTADATANEVCQKLSVWVASHTLKLSSRWRATAEEWQRLVEQEED